MVARSTVLALAVLFLAAVPAGLSRPDTLGSVTDAPAVAGLPNDGTPRPLQPGESVTLEGNGLVASVVQQGGLPTPHSVPPCQVWAGWGDVSPYFSSLHGRSVVSFHAELPMGPTCTVTSVWARINGVDVPYDHVIWDDTDDPNWPHKWIRVTGTLSEALGTGEHRAEIGFTECCGPEGGDIGRSSLNWGFTVSDCGTGSFSLISRQPEGTHAGAVNSIEVRFQDNDIACGLASTQAIIEGNLAPSTWRQDGNDYIITATPPSPIACCSHLIHVSAREICCNRYDGTNGGATSWWLYVINCGAAPTVTDTNPKGTVLGTFATIEARFTDADQTCDLEGHSLSLNGVPLDKSQYTVAREGQDWVFRHYATLLPGPYVAVAMLKEVCCNPSAGQNEALAAWAFSFGVPLAEGEGSLPGAYDRHTLPGLPGVSGGSVALDAAYTDVSWDLLADGDKASVSGSLWIRLDYGGQVFEETLPVNA